MGIKNSRGIKKSHYSKKHSRNYIEPCSKYSKQAQAFSTEVIAALVVFIIAIVFFYGLIAIKTTDITLKREAEKVSNKIPTIDFFEDQEVTSLELKNLTEMDYRDLKTLLGTDAEVCIYFKDSEGNLITLPNNNATLGCPGVNVTAWQR